MSRLPPLDAHWRAAPVARHPRLERLAARAHFDRALWAARDQAWAMRLNHSVQSRAALLLLLAASRLGDGLLWYALLAALPFVAGAEGRACAAQMAIAGLVCLSLYCAIKRWAARPRPFASCADILRRARALDQFSFPSGHTLHAVAFTTIITGHFPAAGWALWPFSLVVAVSRIVLGLHYPSDVAAGALIGGAIGLLVLAGFGAAFPAFQ